MRGRPSPKPRLKIDIPTPQRSDFESAEVFELAGLMPDRLRTL